MWSQNPKTMRVIDKIGAQWAIILIDTSSRLNFLDLVVLARESKSFP